MFYVYMSVKNWHLKQKCFPLVLTWIFIKKKNWERDGWSSLEIRSDTRYAEIEP